LKVSKKGRGRHGQGQSSGQTRGGSRVTLELPRGESRGT